MVGHRRLRSWLTNRLAVANLALVVLFALKTNPLAVVSPWSYERLMCLHRCAGLLTAVFAAVHGICYSAYLVHEGEGDVLLTTKEIMGMVAGGSFAMLALGGLLRNYRYEMFYVSHALFWSLALAALAFHQPLGSLKIVYVSAVAAAIWATHRIFRYGRLLVHSANRTATLTPLPHGATRVTLNKPVCGASGGRHCFLWIPSVRLAETHPFTLASADPPQFVVEARSGFTRALYEFSVQNPGRCVTASVDGPYGTIPDPDAYETVVLVAGGTGATFLFGIARPGGRTRRMVLVWVVQYAGMFVFLSTWRS